MHAVFLDRDSLDLGDLDFGALQRLLPGLVCHASTAGADTAARIAEAEVVISNKVMLDRAALAAAPRLRLVCIAATGTNNVDLAAAAERGLTVCNVRDYGTPSVVQHTFALLLALTTSLPAYRAAVRDGAWSRGRQFCLLDFPIRELAGKTLGIIGHGTLGRAVGGVAEAFGMQVLIAQRPGTDACPPGRVPLAELLPRVDVLSLHCPLTPATQGMIGRAELARMRPGAVLINTARGGLVDEAALAEALRSGALAGAGIDVLSAEPPPPTHPLLAGDLPNLIVTPHCAWGARESRQRLLDQVSENIAAFLAGTPLRVVGG